MADNENLEDFQAFVDRTRTQQALEKATLDQDADKKQAAHAVRLSGPFKADPEYIYNDYDRFTQDKKSTVLEGLLNRNDYVKDYINYVPMATKVSKDDWDNVDEYTRKMDEIGLTHGRQYIDPDAGRKLWEIVSNIASKAGKGMAEPWEQRLGAPPEQIEKLREWFPNLQTPEQWEKSKRTGLLESPLFTAGILNKLADPLLWYKVAQIPLRVMESALTAIPPAAEEAFKQIGVDEVGQKQIFQDAQLVPFLLMHTTRPTGEPIAEFRGRYKEAAKEVSKGIRESQRVIDNLKPFIKSNEPPPVGLDYAIDEMIAESAKKEIKELQDLVKIGDKSDTKQLSPEAHAALTDNITSHTVTVNTDAVRAVYGDKAPMPGDGILGDIPRLVDQYNSPIPPKEIRVPMSFITSKIDSGVLKTIENDIRWRPDSMTLNEIERLKDEKGLRPVENRPELVDKLRAAAGLDPLPLFEPKALGLSRRDYDKVQRLIDKRELEDEAADLRKKTMEEKEKLTPGYLENFKKMTAQVTDDVMNSPAINALKLFSKGEYLGEATGILPKIDPKYLYPNEIEGLPKQYLAEGGLNPDIVGRGLGFKTGHEMIDSLMDTTKDRGALGPKAYWEKLIKQETQRRMDEVHGPLDEQALKSARAQMISRTQGDILHAELAALAKLGKIEKTFTKQKMKDLAWLEARDELQKDVTVINSARDLGKSGRDAWTAWLKNDVQEAYTQKQRQIVDFEKAILAKEGEQVRDNFLALRTRASRSRYMRNVPVENSNFIQQVFNRVGLSVRDEADLAADINHPERVYKTIGEFADANNAISQSIPKGWQDWQTKYDPTLVVYDQLRDPTWGPDFKKKLTFGEMIELNNTVQSFLKHGREREKVILEGKEFDRVETVLMLNESIKNWKNKYIAWSRDPKGLKAPYQFAETMFVGLVQIDQRLNQLADFDPNGPINKMFAYPLARSVENIKKIERKYFNNILRGDKYDIPFDREIPHEIFYDPTLMHGQEIGRPYIPYGGTDWIKLTHEGLINIIGIRGDPQAFDKFVRGFGTTPEIVDALIRQHATADHFRYVMDLVNAFAENKRDTNKLTMRMTNTLIKEPPKGEFDTGIKELGNNGVVGGWYWHAEYDRSRGGGPKEIPGNVAGILRQPSTPGWMVPRDNQAHGPMALNLAWLPGELKRRARFIAMREITHEMGKVFLDPSFLNTVETHMGEHIANGFREYLKSIMNPFDFPSKGVQQGRRFGDWLKDNLVHSWIDFNEGTFTKHSGSSTIASIGEINPLQFARAAWMLLRTDEETGQRNWDWVIKGGEVGGKMWDGAEGLKNRQRDWKFDPNSKAFDYSLGKLGLTEIGIRNMRQFGTLQMRAWDNLISRITWYGRYLTEWDKTKNKMPTWDAHMQAVDFAEASVRRSHGSSSAVNAPEWLQQQGFWAKGVTWFMVMMNNSMNRQWAGVQRIKYGLSGRAESLPKEVVYGLFDLIKYNAVPVAIENFVSPICGDKDSALKCFTKWTVYGGFAWLPVFREIAWASITGMNPGGGVLGGAFTASKNFAHAVQHPKEDPARFAKSIIQLLGVVSPTRGFLGLPGAGTIGKETEYWMDYQRGKEKVPSNFTEWRRRIYQGHTYDPHHHRRY